MADIPTSSWNETAASNTSPAPDGWPSGSLPTIVYLCDREAMGAIKREWNRQGPTVTSGGSANIQTLTYTVEPTAYVQGMRFSFIAGFTNTGATTLNVGGLGAKAIQLAGSALTGGEIISGAIVEVVYDGTQFQILALPSNYGHGLLNVQTFSASGTYTPTTGTKYVIVEVLGGGGAGGGVASTSSGQAAVASGGSSGGYAKVLITSGFSGVTVTVGAGGTAGSAGANVGGNGGTSSFGSAVSCTGGTGGNGGAASSAPIMTVAAAAGTATVSSGTKIASGNGIQGGNGLAVSSSTFITAVGGPSVFGGYSTAIPASGTTGSSGNAAATFGTGGGGAANAASQSARAGSAGFQGFVIVHEFG